MNARACARARDGSVGGRDAAGSEVRRDARTRSQSFGASLTLKAAPRAADSECLEPASSLKCPG
jgi:hypothetical protein